jgi:hypothetical protein
MLCAIIPKITSVYTFVYHCDKGRSNIVIRAASGGTPGAGENNKLDRKLNAAGYPGT